MLLNWEKHGIDISKARGGKMFCPQCHDTRNNKRDKPLSVNIEKGIFNCHYCSFKGCAMEKEKKEWVPKRVFRKPTPKPQQTSSKVVEWFRKRGIGKGTLDRLKVTEATEWMPQVEGQRNCVCFNYYRKGELINIKYRDAEKNFKLEKDAELIFYNLDSLISSDKDKDLIVIVEGEMDCLTLAECGVKCVLSVPNGASRGSQKLEYLDNCAAHFEGFKEIIVATDGDEAGEQLKQELCRRLGKERCYLVKYPDGCKDFNEVLLQHDKATVLSVLNAAELYPLEGIETAEDIYKETLNIYQNGYPQGLKIGIDELDEHISWKGGELTTITGTPGAGKSTWLNNILVKLADRHDWRFGMFTPEKQPAAILTAELAEIMTGKRFRGRGDSVEQMDIDEFNKVMPFISDHFYLMKIDEMEVTIDGILEKARELVVYYGIKGLVIDPWNYIEHKIPHGQSETQYISEALTKVKRFKDRYDVHVFIVAHPTKISRINGAYEIPDLYKISGSAHFFNKTDNGVVVYRNYAEGTTDIHVQKIRWFYIGKIGTVKMRYNIENKRFTSNRPF